MRERGNQVVTNLGKLRACARFPYNSLVVAGENNIALPPKILYL